MPMRCSRITWDLYFMKRVTRVVTKEQAAEYRKKLLPGIRTGGVFVNEDPKTIIELLEEGILDVAQLHGDETEEDIQYLQAVCQTGDQGGQSKRPVRCGSLAGQQCRLSVI